MVRRGTRGKEHGLGAEGNFLEAVGIHRNARSGELLFGFVRGMTFRVPSRTWQASCANGLGRVFR